MKSKSKSVISKVTKVSMKTKSRLSSTKGKSACTAVSDSTIGASRMTKQVSRSGSKATKSMAKSVNGQSYEASNVFGRPKLCQQMAKVTDTKGAVKLTSVKQLQAKGYSVTGDKVAGQQLLSHVKGPKGKKMVLKMIHLKQCTPRYKLTMQRYSLKIMRFIGKKPLMEVFPLIYDIFLVDKSYYIYMGECGSKSLYELVTGKHSQTTAPAKVRTWLRHLTEGVKQLQQYGIAHRFIRLKHLMLDHDRLKIVGWSKSVLFYDATKKKALYQHRERRARKNNFLPPEAFHRLYDPSKADVWAIGVVLVTLTTHRYPFHVRAKMKFTTQWLGFVKKHPMNPIIRSFCNKIFVINTKNRIHAREMLNHNYFKVKDHQLVNASVRGKPLPSTSVAKTSKQSSTSKHKSKEKSASVTSKSSSMTSKSGSYSAKSASQSSKVASRTSKMSTSKIGASRLNQATKTSVKGALTSGASKTKSCPKTSKLSGKVTKSKSSKKLKSDKATQSTTLAKSFSKTLSKTKSKSGSQSKKQAAKSEVVKEVPVEGAAPEEGAEDGAGQAIDGVSKQEVEAEYDDAQAEAQQAAEEAAEPEMEDVAVEAAAQAEADGAVAEAEGEAMTPVAGDDEEGVADEQEMQAPEEAADQANTTEMVPDEGQQLDVDDAVAGQMEQMQQAEGVEVYEGEAAGVPGQEEWQVEPGAEGVPVEAQEQVGQDGAAPMMEAMPGEEMVQQDPNALMQPKVPPKG